MKAARYAVACLAASLMLSVVCRAQDHRDPLNDTEVNQLRDTAQEPEKRLKLYVEFARVRLDAVNQAAADPKIKDPGETIHDRLQDFLDLYDELNDNIDMFADQRDDIRKVLKTILAADTEFQAKLRALKDSSTIPAAEAKHYEFVLENAMDDVDSSVKDHHDLLGQQEELAKVKRLIKPGQQRQQVQGRVH
jgi:hypothetical protein